MAFYVNIPMRLLAMIEASGSARKSLKTGIAMGVFRFASVPMIPGAFELVAPNCGGYLICSG